MDTLYRSWQLSGWLYHDIFVIIVAIIFIVISGILVFLNKKAEYKETGSLCVNFVGLSCSGTFCWFNIFRNVSFSND